MNHQRPVSSLDQNVPEISGGVRGEMEAHAGLSLKTCNSPTTTLGSDRDDFA